MVYETVLRSCTDQLKIPPKELVIFGRSIGSGPSVDLASREVEGSEFSPLDVAGVLLQSPVESGARVVFGDAYDVQFQRQVASQENLLAHPNL